jgi:hypothetical protein
MLLAYFLEADELIAFLSKKAPAFSRNSGFFGDNFAQPVSENCRIEAFPSTTERMKLAITG